MNITKHIAGLSFILALVLAGASQPPLAAAEGALIMSIRFNEPGGASAYELLRGGRLDGKGSGVSGKPDDFCYQGTLKGWKRGRSGALARVGKPPLFENLEEMTITGWYKLNGEAQDTMTMLNCGIGTLIWDQPKKQWVLRVEGTRPVDPEVHMPAYWFLSGKGEIVPWERTDEWIFLAVTWKRSESRAIFHQGSAQAPVARCRDTTMQDEMGPLSDPKSLPVCIGNTGRENTRPMDASIDNVRIFKKALDWESIEHIRMADLKNEEVAGL